MSEHRSEWIIAAVGDGFARQFDATSLPVSVGGEPGHDIRLSGVTGSLQIGELDGVFFVQPGRETRNARVDGEPLTGSRRLGDGTTLALDHARLTCGLDDGRLRLEVEAPAVAGDTAPPDFAELTKAERRRDEVEIAPVVFRPREGSAAAPGPGSIFRRTTAWLTAAAFCVLAVLGWFAFTAKSVQLDFEPEPGVVELPSTLMKLQIGDRYLLRSGEHRVVAELEGYYPLDATIDVGPAPDQSIALNLTKLPGLVTLTSEPESGAQVSLDGEPLGVTPLADVEITPGVHQLTFDAPRYLPEHRELTVEGGGERQRLSARLTPNWAPVTVQTHPPGAEILVDGEPAGAAPLELELEAGEHQVEARLRGYNAWRETIVVTADEPQALPPVELTAADGSVELVTTPADAAVNVNGRFAGSTPLTLTLSPGRTHVITLAKPGYEPVTRELTVAADSGRRLELELEARLGVIEVVSVPPGAELWVDGQQYGTTPTEITLTAVEHRLEVRRPGYATEAREMTPRPGFPQRLNLTLTALDAVSGAGYPQAVRTSLDQTLRLVTPGQFVMGSSRRDPNRRANEVLRPVQLSKAFYLGVHEVSNAEFRAFRADHDSGAFGGVSLNADEQPVVRVGWQDVAQYLNWLSIRDGLQPVYEQQQDGRWAPVRPLRNGYRLPTEAEWAWAARFAARESPLVYPWGAELPPPDRSGNYADVSAAELLPTTLVTYSDGFAVSAPSGSFGPNAVGIHDLGGNVAEWVQDFYAVETDADPPLAVDPLGPQSGRFHVTRGSSWRSATVNELRLAYRDYADGGSEFLGFRLARNVE